MPPPSPSPNTPAAWLPLATPTGSPQSTQSRPGTEGNKGACVGEWRLTHTVEMEWGGAGCEGKGGMGRGHSQAVNITWSVQPHMTLVRMEVTWTQPQEDINDRGPPHSALLTLALGATLRCLSRLSGVCGQEDQP